MTAVEHWAKVVTNTSTGQAPSQHLNHDLPERPTQGDAKNAAVLSMDGGTAQERAASHGTKENKVSLVTLVIKLGVVNETSFTRRVIDGTFCANTQAQILNSDWGRA